MQARHTVCLLVLSLLALTSVCVAQSTDDMAHEAHQRVPVMHIYEARLTGAVTGWPADDTSTQAQLRTPATTTLCEALRRNVTTDVNTTTNATADVVANCTAFVSRESVNNITLHMTALTLQPRASLRVYGALQRWVTRLDEAVLTSFVAAAATALGVAALDPLTFSSATYRMPCRDGSVYSFLPVCRPPHNNSDGSTTGSGSDDSNDNNTYEFDDGGGAAEQRAAVTATTLFVDSPTGDLHAYFMRLLCSDDGGGGGASSGSGSACAAANVTVTAPSFAESMTRVDIVNASRGLEAALTFVADVRAAALLEMRAVSDWGGNATAGVTARAVWLTAVPTANNSNSSNSTSNSTSPRVPLYDAREYTQDGNGTAVVVVTCSATTGMWAMAFLGLLPIALIVVRYAWYRGRHRAKKRERQAIVDDEQRLMRGEATAMTTTAAGAAPSLSGEAGNSGTGTMMAATTMTPNYMTTAAPPPGFDASATGGEAGYYYAGNWQQQQQQQQQQWVMDEYGNYYDVSNTQGAYAGADENNGGAAAAGGDDGGAGEYAAAAGYGDDARHADTDAAVAGAQDGAAATTTTAYDERQREDDEANDAQQSNNTQDAL